MKGVALAKQRGLGGTKMLVNEIRQQNGEPPRPPKENTGGRQRRCPLQTATVSPVVI